MVIEIAGQLIERALWHVGEVGVAWHEASNALVGVFDTAFLPRRAWVAEPAASTNSVFQSPKAGKLGTAIKREALAREGWQRRKRSDDSVHDWT